MTRRFASNSARFAITLTLTTTLLIAANSGAASAGEGSAGATSAGVGAAGPSAAPLAGDPEVTKALRFRKSFFLDTDPATVNALGDRARLAGQSKVVAGMVDVDTSYGVPLTKAEKAEIDRRQGLLDKHAAKLDAQLIKLGDKVPDVSLDHERAKLVVRTKLPTSSLAAKFRSLGIASTDLVVESPRWTMEQLLGFQQKVSAARKAGDTGLTGISGHGIDHETQQLDVLTSGSLADAQASLSKLLPAGTFKVRAGKAQMTDQQATDPSPYHGGWKISWSTGGSCTLGVPAYGPGPKFYLLSAGHCAPVGAAMCQPTCVTGYKGLVAASAFHNGVREPRADALAIGSAAQYTHAKVYGGTKMVTRETWNSDHLGQIDCMLGAFSRGATCGRLLRKTQEYGDYAFGVFRSLKYGRMVDFVSTPGD